MEIIFELVSFCETLFISLSQEMKIHIIKKQTIEEFIKKNSQSKSSFEVMSNGKFKIYNHQI